MELIFTLLMLALGTLVYVFIGGVNIGCAIANYKDGNYNAAGWSIMWALVITMFVFKLLF